MLITFKSKAAADVVMYKEHASRILELFGKSPDQGIITAEETANALKKLEAEISDSKQFPRRALRRTAQPGEYFVADSYNLDIGQPLNPVPTHCSENHLLVGQ
mgnify:CR=1 FL=1